MKKFRSVSDFFVSHDHALITWVNELHSMLSKLYGRTLLNEKNPKTFKLKWLGADLLISTEKSKGKISISQTEVQLNNLKNEERAGFVEAKLGMAVLPFTLSQNANGVHPSLIKCIKLL